MKSYQGAASPLSSLPVPSLLGACSVVNNLELFISTVSGTYYLSGNTASRWYFDPPIPEAQQFSSAYVLSA
jgi:hypothetical protein